MLHACKAAEDDLLPLSTPIVTSTGEAVSSVFIAKGTTTFVPIRLMNQAEWLWSPDAQEFRPERWLEPNFGEKNEVQGHRHLLSFTDGPRACLGKNFALVEFKVSIYVTRVIQWTLVEADVSTAPYRPFCRSSSVTSPSNLKVPNPR